MAITTVRTASEVHGIGADIIRLGTGTHGLILHGDTTDGTILSTSEDGMTLGITEVGTVHGITADGMTHGTMEDGTLIITTMDTGHHTHLTDLTIMEKKLYTVQRRGYSVPEIQSEEELEAGHSPTETGPEPAQAQAESQQGSHRQSQTAQRLQEPSYPPGHQPQRSTRQTDRS